MLRVPFWLVTNVVSDAFDFDRRTLEGWILDSTLPTHACLCPIFGCSATDHEVDPTRILIPRITTTCWLAHGRRVAACDANRKSCRGIRTGWKKNIGTTTTEPTLRGFLGLGQMPASPLSIHVDAGENLPGNNIVVGSIPAMKNAIGAGIERYIVYL